MLFLTGRTGAHILGSTFFYLIGFAQVFLFFSFSYVFVACFTLNTLSAGVTKIRPIERLVVVVVYLDWDFFSVVPFFGGILKLRERNPSFISQILFNKM
ncbi:hypothetical protein ACJX0J_024849, partial [Zea mays]